MNLIDLLNSVWAILPEKLLQIENIITAHMKGEKLDLKKIEARLFALDGPGNDAPYDVVNGSAIIPVNGVLSNNPSAFERIFFNSSSMSKIRADVSNAVSDPSVNQIVLHVDSPGGTVAGMQETANHIYNLRGDKPIIAFSDQMIASAAYGIGAAADKVFISGDNVAVGSIGTIYRHVDRSKQNENAGLAVTEFVSGKFKNALTENAPLNQERSEYIQSIVDKSLETFAADLGKFRGLKQENMGEGKVFFGKDAIRAGLVDGFSSLESIINGTVAGEQSANKSPVAVAAELQEDTIVNIQELQEKHPDIFAEAVALGKTEMDAKINAAKLEGKIEELARVNGIKASSISGHEALVDALIANGSTVEAAMAAIIKAENDKRAGVLASLKNDAPAPVAAAAAPEPEPEKDFGQMVDEHMKANKSSRGVAVAAIAKEFPDVHKAYLEKVNSGGK